MQRDDGYCMWHRCSVAASPAIIGKRGILGAGLTTLTFVCVVGSRNLGSRALDEISKIPSRESKWQ